MGSAHLLTHNIASTAQSWDNREEGPPAASFLPTPSPTYQV